MLEQVSSLLSSPWVYALIASSVLLDVFLPVLPSGALVIAAASTGAAGHALRLGEFAALLICAAGASCLGDMAAFRLARRGGDCLVRRLDRSRKLSAAQERIGEAVRRGGGPLVVLARFAPAGRSVVSLGAGVAHRRTAEFLPWSALAGIAWAGYSVGVGYLGGRWFGATWFGTTASFAALVCAGGVAARSLRQGAIP